MVAVRLSLLACYLNAQGEYDEAAEYAREALDFAWQHELNDVATRTMQRLPATAVLRKQSSTKSPRETFARAARILGFADAQLAARRSSPMLSERLEHDRVLTVLRGAIGDAKVANAMALGSAMTQEQAINEAMDAAGDRSDAAH
jgi:hypothetical protein